MLKNTQVRLKVKQIESPFPQNSKEYKLEALKIQNQAKVDWINDYLHSKVKNMKKINCALNFNAKKEELRTQTRDKENVNSANTRFGILSKNTVVRSLNNTQLMKNLRTRAREVHSRKVSCNFSRELPRENKAKVFKKRSHSSNALKEPEFDLNPWKFEADD